MTFIILKYILAIFSLFSFHRKEMLDLISTFFLAFIEMLMKFLGPSFVEVV